MKKLLISGCWLLLLSGCVLYPPYRRPPMPIPDEWRTPTSEASTIANVRWWEQFGDPYLDDLILTALKNNNDLLAAASRVNEFRFLVGIARAPLFPQISATAIESRQRIALGSLFGLNTASDPTLASILSALSPYSTTYEGLFNLSYEFDFWGKVQSQVDVARYQLAAQIDARRTVILGLVSSVASTYVQLMQDIQLLRVSQETVKSREEAYRIAKLRFEGGLTSELEVKQAASLVDTAILEVLRLEATIPQTENMISILIGEPPRSIQRGRPIENWPLPPRIPSGLPSDLLNQRPDIQQAENDLRAANARIGEARAAFFPSISLTGYYGNESPLLHQLFTGPFLIWQYLTNATVPIFTGGRNINNLELTEARKQTAIYQYRQVVLTAFREVDDALIGYQKARELLEAQLDRIKVLNDYLHLAKLQYDNGQTDYLNVLDAERQLFQAELEAEQARADVYTRLIEVYRALGGGWVMDADSERDCLAGTDTIINTNGPVMRCPASECECERQ